MEGYGPATYGDAFADVYDDWYRDVASTDGAVARLAELAGGGPVLELGVGTGRLAVPLAARGVDVWGVDASAAMLARLAARPGGGRVRAVLGDMAGVDLGNDAPGFAVVVVARNTLFNLTTAEAQAACVAAAAARLAPGGCVVIEAFVPGDGATAAAVEVRQVEMDRVVLSASRRRAADQVVDGQHIEISEAGIRLRPWSIRYATPAQLDELAAGAGLTLAERSGGWRGEPFDATSTAHVSVYRRASSGTSVDVVPPARPT